MVTLGTYLHVADNSGVRLVSCVKILGNTYKKNAKLGDLLIVSIKRVKKSVPFIKAKRRRWIRYSKGKLHRVLLVRIGLPFRRAQGIYLKFNQNAVIFINKRNVPLTKRVKGPIPFELCKKYLGLGRICESIV